MCLPSGSQASHLMWPREDKKKTRFLKQKKQSNYCFLLRFKKIMSYLICTYTKHPTHLISVINKLLIKSNNYTMSNGLVINGIIEGFF